MNGPQPCRGPPARGHGRDPTRSNAAEGGGGRSNFAHFVLRRLEGDPAGQWRRSSPRFRPRRTSLPCLCKGTKEWLSAITTSHGSRALSFSRPANLYPGTNPGAVRGVTAAAYSPQPYLDSDAFPPRLEPRMTDRTTSATAARVVASVTTSAGVVALGALVSLAPTGTIAAGRLIVPVVAAPNTSTEPQEAPTVTLPEAPPASESTPPPTASTGAQAVALKTATDRTAPAPAAIGAAASRVPGRAADPRNQPHQRKQEANGTQAARNGATRTPGDHAIPVLIIPGVGLGRRLGADPPFRCVVGVPQGMAHLRALGGGDSR